MAKSAKQILIDAKALLDTRGWAKRKDVEAQLSVPKAGMKTWSARTDVPICLGLAILNSVPDAEQYRDDHMAATRLVNNAIDPKVDDSWHGPMFDFNDKPKTTRKDVDRVLDAAIAKA